MIITFSTLNALKRAAKKLSKETGILHTEALEVVSRQAGFQNYVHASRVLDDTCAQRLFPAHILVSWRNRQEKTTGTEHLIFDLPQSLVSFVKPQHLDGHYLGGFSFDGTDRLAGEIFSYSNMQDQTLARRQACRAARALQFTLATGFQPSDAHRCYPKGRWHNRAPGSDHDRKWYHPATKSHILTIEPYSDLSRSYQAECDSWCKDFGYEIIKSSRMSIYGLGTNLYFVGKLGSKLNLKSVADHFDQTCPTIDENDPNLRWE